MQQHDNDVFPVLFWMLFRNEKLTSWGYLRKEIARPAVVDLRFAQETQRATEMCPLEYTSVTDDIRFATTVPLHSALAPVRGNCKALVFPENIVDRKFK